MRSLRTIAFATFLVTLAGSTTANATLSSGGEACVSLFGLEAPLRNFKASHTLSQEVRDNAPDYYRFSLEHASEYFGKLLDYKGFIVGDTHPGNFIIAPIDGELRFHIADLKDAGVAPFILDFTRLAMSTHSIFKRVDERPKFSKVIETLFDSYMNGLRQQPAPENKPVDVWLSENVKAYDELSDKYVEKHTKGGRFKFKEDAIEQLPDGAEGQAIKDSLTQIVQTHFPKAKVFDFAIRPRDRGGSKNLLRYWALIKIGNKKKQIIEFKEIPKPATEFYSADQDATAIRYDKLMKIFWQAKDPFVKVVSIGGEDFLMRRKKIDLIEFSYKPETEDEQRDLLSLAAYDAHYVGLLHARQLGPNATYLNDLVLRRVEILDAIRRFSKDYLSHLNSEIQAKDEK